MIESIHLSKNELKHCKGDLTLPHADARELTDAQKQKLNINIAKIISEKGSTNA